MSVNVLDMFSCFGSGMVKFQFPIQIINHLKQFSPFFSLKTPLGSSFVELYSRSHKQNMKFAFKVKIINLFQ